MAKKKNTTYKVGEGKLLTEQKELSLKKLMPYMINTGKLTGIYIVSTDLEKSKPKKITKAAMAKMSTTEKKLIEKQMVDYLVLLEREKNNSYLEINHSWIELCVYMLGTIYSNNKNNFLNVLLHNGVMSNGFNVTTELVKYGTGDSYRDAYKIHGSNFYLETNSSGSAICTAIKGMAKALELEKDKELLFNITPIEEIKLKEGVIEELYTEVTLSQALNIKNDRLKIAGLTFEAEKKFVGSNTECLAVILTYMYRIYKSNLIVACEKFGKPLVVGISKENTDNTDTLAYKPIKYAKAYCYSNGDAAELIEYLNKVLTELGYMPMLINLTIREGKFKQTN